MSHVYVNLFRRFSTVVSTNSTILAHLPNLIPKGLFFSHCVPATWALRAHSWVPFNGCTDCPLPGRRTSHTWHLPIIHSLSKGASLKIPSLLPTQFPMLPRTLFQPSVCGSTLWQRPGQPPHCCVLRSGKHRLSE